MDLRDAVEWLVLYYDHIDGPTMKAANNIVRIDETMVLVVPLIAGALPAPEALTWSTYLQDLADFIVGGVGIGPDPGAPPSLASLLLIEAATPARVPYPEGYPLVYP